MSSVTANTRRWISVRVRLTCAVVFVIGTMLPPYVPKAALAPQETTVAQQQFLLVEDGFLLKSSSLTRQGARRAYTKGIVHVVKSGESMESLARRYNVSLQTIRWANGLNEQSTLHPNDELVILPVDGVLHTVKRGQTLMQIAELYDIPLEQIRERNEVEGAYLVAGQQLIIPGGKPIVEKPTVVAAQPAAKPGEKPSRPAPEGTPQALVEVAGESVTYGVLQKPCSDECFITQYYNPSHYALDLQDRGGGPVFAAEGGTVIRADIGWNGGYGNVVEIDHGNDLITVYGHNKQLHVSVGDEVTRGQKIADMGNTGLVYGKTGIHVHFEVRLKGVKKNPLLYIQ